VAAKIVILMISKLDSRLSRNVSRISEMACVFVCLFVSLRFFFHMIANFLLIKKQICVN
jgi:hypothetical protein